MLLWQPRGLVPLSAPLCSERGVRTNIIHLRKQKQNVLLLRYEKICVLYVCTGEVNQSTVVAATIQMSTVYLYSGTVEPEVLPLLECIYTSLLNVFKHEGMSGDRGPGLLLVSYDIICRYVSSCVTAASHSASFIFYFRFCHLVAASIHTTSIKRSSPTTGERGTAKVKTHPSTPPPCASEEGPTLVSAGLIIAAPPSCRPLSLS